MLYANSINNIMFVLLPFHYSTRFILSTPVLHLTSQDSTSPFELKVKKSSSPFLSLSIIACGLEGCARWQIQLEAVN